MSMRSAARLIDQGIRAAERRAAKQDRIARERARSAQVGAAEDILRDFEKAVERLVTFHKYGPDFIDWLEKADAPKPVEPQHTYELREAAERKLEDYEASLLDRLFGRTETKINILRDEVRRAENQDNLRFEKEMTKHEKAVANWRDDKELATGVMGGDLECYRKVVAELTSFEELAEICTECKVKIDSDNRAEATVHVHGEDVIPDSKWKVLKSGNLSQRRRSKSDFYALYKNALCSAILRIARELFALLPIRIVGVSVVCNMLNTETGYAEDTVILSCVIREDELRNLNMERVVPGDAINNFKHNINFLKTKGFRAVEKIDVMSAD